MENGVHESKRKKKRTGKSRYTAPRRTWRRAGGNLPSYLPSRAGGESAHGKHVGRPARKPTRAPDTWVDSWCPVPLSHSRSIVPASNHSLPVGYDSTPSSSKMISMRSRGGCLPPFMMLVGKRSLVDWRPPFLPSPSVKLAAGLVHARAQQHALRDTFYTTTMPVCGYGLRKSVGSKDQLPTCVGSVL